MQIVVDEIALLDMASECVRLVKVVTEVKRAFAESISSLDIEVRSMYEITREAELIMHLQEYVCSLLTEGQFLIEDTVDAFTSVENHISGYAKVLTGSEVNKNKYQDLKDFQNNNNNSTQRNALYAKISVLPIITEKERIYTTVDKRQLIGMKISMNVETL